MRHQTHPFMGLKTFLVEKISFEQEFSKDIDGPLGRVFQLVGVWGNKGVRYV